MPKIYRLPKNHKPGILLRLFFLGLELTPDLSKSLAKILTLLLGTINYLHFKNSGDLLNKIDN